jgi:hypothetical protein
MSRYAGKVKQNNNNGNNHIDFKKLELYNLTEAPESEKTFLKDEVMI